MSIRPCEVPNSLSLEQQVPPFSVNGKLDHSNFGDNFSRNSNKRRTNLGFASFSMNFYPPILFQTVPGKKLINDARSKYWLPLFGRISSITFFKKFGISLVNRLILFRRRKRRERKGKKKSYDALKTTYLKSCEASKRFKFVCCIAYRFCYLLSGYRISRS